MIYPSYVGSQLSPYYVPGRVLWFGVVNVRWNTPQSVFECFRVLVSDMLAALIIVPLKAPYGLVLY